MSLANRLTELLKQHGPNLLRDQRKLFALAEAGKWPERERFLLKVAYRSRVVERLLSSADEAIQRQACKNLTAEFALSAGAAEDIVRALSAALNHTPPPRLAPRKLPPLPRLFTHGSGRLAGRLSLAAVLVVLIGFVLGWLLGQTGDSQATQALKEGQQQQSQLQQQIQQAKDDATTKRLALQAELEKLKSASAPANADPTGGRVGANPPQTSPACPNCPILVALPGGEFMMGSDTGESDEKPVHAVNVQPFKMATYEVTQAQWQAVMNSNPSNFKDCGGDCPVESVSLNDAQAYIAKLNQQTGLHYTACPPRRNGNTPAGAAGNKNIAARTVWTQWLGVLATRAIQLTRSATSSPTALACTI